MPLRNNPATIDLRESGQQTVTSSRPPLVETDGRSRISLKKAGIEANSLLFVHVLDGGRILLEPAEVRSEFAATMDRTLPDRAVTVAQNRNDDYPVDPSALSILERLAQQAHETPKSKSPS